MNPLTPLPTALGDFAVRSIGKDQYKLTLRSSTKYIEQTGAIVDTYLRLPIGHKLLKMELKHTDNTDADSVASLAYYLKHLAIENLFYTLRGDAACAASDIIETFGDEYVHASSTYYLLRLNTTNTHRIYPVFYIEQLGG